MCVVRACAERWASDLVRMTKEPLLIRPDGVAQGEARGDGGAGGGGGEGDRDAGGGGVGDATQTSSVIIPETTDERVFFLALGLSGFAMMLTGIVFMTHSWYLTHSSAAILARARPK